MLPELVCHERRDRTQPAGAAAHFDYGVTACEHGKVGGILRLFRTLEGCSGAAIAVRRSRRYPMSRIDGSARTRYCHPSRWVASRFIVSLCLVFASWASVGCDSSPVAPSRISTAAQPASEPVGPTPPPMTLVPPPLPPPPPVVAGQPPPTLPTPPPLPMPQITPVQASGTMSSENVRSVH
jgi:hypothetical protein